LHLIFKKKKELWEHRSSVGHIIKINDRSIKRMVLMRYKALETDSSLFFFICRKKKNARFLKKLETLVHAWNFFFILLSSYARGRGVTFLNVLTKKKQTKQKNGPRPDYNSTDKSTLTKGKLKCTFYYYSIFNLLPKNWNDLLFHYVRKKNIDTNFKTLFFIFLKIKRCKEIYINIF